jgi:hypothetical protein
VRKNLDLIGEASLLLREVATKATLLKSTLPRFG